MVNIYDNLCHENGVVITGRTKLFVETHDENGEIIAFRSGTLLIPETSGTMFIVDEWIIKQIDKLLFMDGQLVVKEGETIEEPVKTEKELKREELLRQIAELDALEDKVTAEK